MRHLAPQLLVSQLIADQLRSVPAPEERARWALDQRRCAADTMLIEGVGLDEEARLRVRVKERVVEILEAALERVRASQH